MNLISDLSALKFCCLLPAFGGLGAQGQPSQPANHDLAGYKHPIRIPWEDHGCLECNFGFGKRCCMGMVQAEKSGFVMAKSPTCTLFTKDRPTTEL